MSIIFETLTDGYLPNYKDSTLKNEDSIDLNTDTRIKSLGNMTVWQVTSIFVLILILKSII